MKSKSIFAIASLIALVASTSAHAHLDFKNKPNSKMELGLPVYNGTGCPADSVAAVVSPDNTQLSVLFSEYVAEAGKNYGKQIDRKNCQLAIPVRVPQGYSVSIIQVDYRGLLALPPGAQAQFSAEYFFSNARGPRKTETFRGPMSQNYVIGNTLEATALVWSKCGADTNLRIATSMLARTNPRGDDTLATVDSTDIDTNMIYHLQWKRCN